MQHLQQRAQQILSAYQQHEQQTYGRSWTPSDRAMGLVGDIGDLIKLVQAKSGIRTADGDLDQKMAHELADILWVVLVLAQEYDIDIEKAFEKTMDELEDRLLIQQNQSTK